MITEINLCSCSCLYWCHTSSSLHRIGKITLSCLRSSLHSILNLCISSIYCHYLFCHGNIFWYLHYLRYWITYLNRRKIWIFNSFFHCFQFRKRHLSIHESEWWICLIYNFFHTQSYFIHISKTLSDCIWIQLQFC